MRSQAFLYDAVVVGSGAGGSVAFSELVSAGKKVLLIEEGPTHAAESDTESVFQGIQRYYRDGGLRPIFSNAGVIPFGEARVLGGGTQINGGLYWPTPEGVLKKWNDDGSFCAAEELKSNIDFFGRALGVHPEAQFGSFDKDSSLLEKGASSLGLTLSTAMRATTNCARANRCAVGCPTGAKNSTNLTLIPRAEASGGEVWVNCRLLRFKEHRKGNLTCVVRKAGEGKRVVATKALYLAAGPFESPTLITRSSESKFGKFPLALHLNAKVMARFPGPVHAQRSTIFTKQFQDLEAGRMLFMATAHGKDYAALSGSFLSRDLAKAILEEPANWASYTAQVAPSNLGLQLNFLGYSLRWHTINRETERRLQAAISLLVSTLLQAGADKIILPIKQGVVISSDQGLQEAWKEYRTSDLNISSVHAMSSLPLTSSKLRKKSRIDENGRLRKFRNVWICCASILPSHTIESPQATIMGLSKWVVEQSLKTAHGSDGDRG